MEYKYLISFFILFKRQDSDRKYINLRIILIRLYPESNDSERNEGKECMKNVSCVRQKDNL